MKRRWLVVGAVTFGVCAVLLGVWLLSYERKGAMVGPVRTVSVSLYFGQDNSETLVSESRVVELVDGYADIGKVVQLLLEGPREVTHIQVIPEGTRLIEWYIDGQVAVLNFSRQLMDNHPGGSAAEMQTVFSIVNTVTSIPGITSVKILVEGQEVESLAGHVDLTEPLGFSREIVQNG